MAKFKHAALIGFPVPQNRTSFARIMIAIVIEEYNFATNFRLEPRFAV